MLWNFTIKALVSQIVLLSLFGLLIKTLSPEMRKFFSSHWHGASFLVWATTFVLSLAIGGFILGLVVATTTTFLLGVWAKLYMKFSQPD